MATATTACGDVNDIPSTGTGGAYARCVRRHTAPRLQPHKTTPLRPARAHAAATLAPRRASAHRESPWHPPPQHQQQPQDHSTRAHAALRQTSTAPACLAPPPVATPLVPRHHARTTTHDDEKMLRARMDTTQKTPIDVGYGGTGRPPRRQRGARLVPLMRAFLIPPHGRHHKAPPRPCALTTSLIGRGVLRFASCLKTEDLNTPQ